MTNQQFLIKLLKTIVTHKQIFYHYGRKNNTPKSQLKRGCNTFRKLYLLIVGVGSLNDHEVWKKILFSLEKITSDFFNQKSQILFVYICVPNISEFNINYKQAPTLLCDY